jgi:WD40 repeat protein
MSVLDKKLTPRPRRRSRRGWYIALGILAILILLLLFTNVGSDAAFVAHFVAPPKHFTYTGHSDYVSGVAWSPDGKRIASASGDHTAQVWDAANGGHVLTYRGHSSDVLTIAWSPDGRCIASTSDDGTVQIWDAFTGQHVLTYTGPSSVRGSAPAAANAVAFSPDGKYLAIGGVGAAVLLDASTAKVLGYYGPHGGEAHAVAFSPDGRYLAIGRDDSSVQVWNVVSVSNVYTYSGHSTDVFTLAWSPDGKRIASGDGNGSVQVWDALTGAHVYTYRGHVDYYWGHFTSNQAVNCLAWSPDGRQVASGSSDDSVQVWEAM